MNRSGVVSQAVVINSRGAEIKIRLDRLVRALRYFRHDAIKHSPEHLREAMAKATELDRVAFGKGFEWNELCDLAGFMIHRDLDPGEFLFDEGDPGTFMGVLLGGVLRQVQKSDRSIGS